MPTGAAVRSLNCLSVPRSVCTTEATGKLLSKPLTRPEIDRREPAIARRVAGNALLEETELEAWLTFGDIESRLRDEYLLALGEGHGREAALARAAALLSMHRDQLASAAISLRLAQLILDVSSEDSIGS